MLVGIEFDHTVDLPDGSAVSQILALVELAGGIDLVDPL